METKNVLITGSSGFIGSSLLKKIGDVHNVTLLDKREPISNIQSKEFIFIKADLSNQHALNKVQGRIDVVYHFGSISSIRQYEGSSLNGAIDTLSSFINVMEFAKHSDVERVIYPSSGTVYGNTSSSLLRKIAPVNIYGAMKYTSEMIADLYSAYFNVYGLRIFMGYGEGEEKKGEIGSPVFLFLDKMINNESPIIWGDGKQSRDLIHINDIVEVAEKCMHISESKLVFDVGTGVRTNFLFIIDMINEISHKGIMPKFIEKPTNYLETTTADPEFMTKILGHQPMSTKKGIERFYDYLSHQDS